MGILTRIPEDVIKDKLFYDYGISVLYIGSFSSGISDTSYCVRSVGGVNYFIKLYESASIKDVCDEVSLLRALYDSNLPVSRALSMRSACGRHGLVKGDINVFVSRIGAKPFCIFNFIGGYSPCFIEPFHIRELAYFLARFHNFSISNREFAIGFAEDHLFSSRFLFLLEEVLSSSNKNKELSDDARSIFHPFLKILEQVDYEETDGIIHTDLFPDNTSFKAGDLIGVFDFASFCFGSFYFDLGVIILSWCMHGNVFFEGLFNLFISTYRQYANKTIYIRKLVSWLKLSALFYALQRYYMEKIRRQNNLHGKTYKEYIDKLFIIDSLGRYG